MLSRRDLIGKVAAGTAGAAVVWAAGVGRANAALARGGTNEQLGSGFGEDPLAELPAATVEPTTAVIDANLSATASASSPWQLVRPLALGSMVAHGWRVSELTSVIDGSCVLTLENARGRAHRVHLCRNDGQPHGLVQTKRFDLVVMNGGLGELPTEEGLAQAVAAVAHVLAANEGDRQQERLFVALLPHAERLRLFAGPMDRRLR